MKLIVCMKQVFDPEAPASAFKVDSEGKRVIPIKGTPPVLNPFDQNALEAGLRIKDTQNAEITVISMGRNLSTALLRKSLAAGADRLILLEDDAFQDLDSYSAAYVLAKAINKIGNYDLILCGREAADTDSGQVGSGIAEILGIPSITVVRKLEVSNRKMRVQRVVSDGYEVVETTMPALVTASSEIGELRTATLKAIMAAQKKEVIVWNAGELGIDACQMGRRTNLLSLFPPVRRESNCQIVDGETPEEAGAKLALRLRAAGLV